MFLITLDKVKNMDILKKIYLGMYEYKLARQVFLVYVPDVIERSYNIKNLISNVIKVKAVDFKNIDEFEIEDILYDFAEKKGKIVFDYAKCTKALRKKIEELIEEVGLEVINTDNPLDIENIDLSCMSANDLNIVCEFFNSVKATNFYTTKDFLFRYVVNDNGVVIDETTKKKVGNLTKDSFLEILLNGHDDIKDRIEKAEKVFNNSTLSNVLYEPWAFLNYDENINQKIYDYKRALFDIIKNLPPERYSSLCPELTAILNSNTYVQFNDIKAIISGEDEAIKYY